MYTMLKIQNFLNSLQSEEGQGLAEYALIIVLVAIAVVVALTSLGTNISGTFDTIVESLSV